MADARLSRAKRLRKRKAFATLRLVQRDAVLNRNLTAPKPKPVRAVVRDHAGTLRLVETRDCSSSPERLGSLAARFADPKGNSINGGSTPRKTSPAPRWAGAQSGDAAKTRASALGSLGASLPLPPEPTRRRKAGKAKAKPKV